MGLEVPGIELVNSGLLGLHHICLERGETDRQIHVETSTDRQLDREMQ